MQTGMVEASSKEAAIALLQRNRLFVTFLDPTEKKPFWAKNLAILQHVSKKDIVNFSRQLALMFTSKIPLLQALESIAEQTKNQGFKEKIEIIAQEIEGGTKFSQALSSHPKLFSSFYISMVKSGEASGTLSESLTYLADHLEREYHLQAKIQGAMIYPIMIVVVVTGVLVMMMYFVIPSITNVLVETGQELPLMTKIVIVISNIMRKFGLIVFGVIGVGIFFLVRYTRTPKGLAAKDRFILKVPFLKSFLQMVYISRFSENLSTLVAGGLPISQSLEITGEVVGNQVYKDIIVRLKEEVGKGENISKVLREYPDKFPPILVQMVAVGEKTGTLDKSLMNVVDFYRKEVERAIENLLSILEPLMVVILGGIVAGLMASVLLPLYKMTSF